MTADDDDGKKILETLFAAKSLPKKLERNIKHSKGFKTQG